MKIGRSGRCTRPPRGLTCVRFTHPGSRRNLPTALPPPPERRHRGERALTVQPGPSMNRLYLLAAAGLVALAACADDATSPARTPSSPTIRGPNFSVAVTSVGVSGTTANDLAQSLGGAGVTIQNVTYTGANGAAGTYTGGAGNVGFDGLVLSTGTAANAAGPNTSAKKSTINGTPGDADISAAIGVTTFDAASLSFEIIANADSVFFQ